MLIQQGAGLRGRLGIARFLRLPEIGQSLYRDAPSGHLHFRRQCRLAVRHRVTALQNILNTGHIAIGRPGRQKRKHIGNLDSGHHFQALFRPSLLQSFQSCQLHRLVLRHLVSRLVAGKSHYQSGHDAENRCHLDAGCGKTLMPSAQQVPTADPDHESRSKHPAAQYRMEELGHRHRLECHRPEIHHLVADCFGIELHAHRMLHPGIGHQNPPGRNRSPDAGEPGRSQMKAFAYLVPAKEHDCDECSLHEERQDAFDGQRRPEDIAHEPRVIAPVGPELEFQNQTGSHAYREIDPEDLHPELGGLFPKGIACLYIDCLHDAHDHGKTQCQGNKEPMVHGRHRELRPRPVNQARRNLFNHSISVFDTYSKSPFPTTKNLPVL